MRAVWLENQTFTYRTDIEVPTPNDHEALIKVILAGICGTDIQLAKGYYPFSGVPGHEFVGEVVSAASKPELVGKRVVGEINMGCGKCEACTNGQRNHCQSRQILGIKNHSGAFAEYLCLPIANLHLVPEGVSNHQAVFTEPLAAALRILEQVNITSSTKVLLIGAGRLGQLIALVLKYVPCELAVIARHDIQIHHLFELAVEIVAENEETDKCWEVVIEATGTVGGLETALGYVQAGGTVVVKSTFKEQSILSLSQIVVDEITMIGSRCGPFDKALQFIEKYQPDLSSLIHQTVALEDFASALQMAGQKDVIKVLIKP